MSEVLNTVSPLITAMATIALVLVIWWQLKLIQQTLYRDSFLKVIEILQNEKIREARGRLFSIAESKNSVDEWLDEDKKIAEKVASTYDSVGIMISNGVLPIQIVDHWGRSVVRSWNSARLLIGKYRSEREDLTLWDDFENWAKKASERNEGKFHEIFKPLS